MDVETLLGKELKDSFRQAVKFLMVIIYFNIKVFFDLHGVYASVACNTKYQQIYKLLKWQED
jgi:hypothetical protein